MLLYFQQNEYYQKSCLLFILLWVFLSLHPVENDWTLCKKEILKLKKKEKFIYLEL